MNLLGAKLYDPAVAVSKSTASLLALTALDTSNLRLTVTVPAHGMLRFRLRGVVEGATTFPTILLGVLQGATVIGRVAPVQSLGNTAVATADVSVEADFCVSGLAAGSTTFDAAYAVQVVVSSTNLKYGGPNDASGNDAWGGFCFEIYDPQPIPTAAPGASTGLLISGSNSGTTTLGALTVTGSTTLSDGLIVNRSTTNASAITATGNGTGNGIVATGGSGATGDGIQATAASTNGRGMSLTGTGTGAALLASGGTDGVTFTGGNGNGLTISTTGSGKDGLNTTGGTGGSGIRTTGGSGAHGINTIGGSGGGNGLTATGSSGHGISAAGNGSSGHGLVATGSGTGAGINATAGATGNGLAAVGGSSSGDGINSVASNLGHGLTVTGKGTSKHGINAAGGATTGNGILVTGGSTSGDALKLTTTSGHGINSAPVGSNMHGILSTGGNGGTSDGFKCVAGTGGVDIRGNITGNITGTLSTLTTYTGNTPQTGDSFALIGTAGVGLTNLGDTRIAHLNADVNSRMPTFTLPTNFSSLGINAAGLVNTLRNGTAQAGDGFHITLDAGASALDGFYQDNLIYLTSGTGAGQVRFVSRYTGATQVAEVIPNWTTAPDNTTVFAILPAGQVDVGAWFATAVFTDTQGLPEVGVGGWAGTAAIKDASTGLPVVTANVVHSGICQANTNPAQVVLDAAASATDGDYIGLLIWIWSRGGRQARTITAYTGATKTATIDRNWLTTPTTSDKFIILVGNNAANVETWLGQPVSLNVNNYPEVSVRQFRGADVVVGDDAPNYPIVTLGAITSGNVGEAPVSTVGNQTTGVVFDATVGDATASNQTSILNAVNAITNVTARSAPKVPSLFLRPGTGSTLYRSYLFLYNLQGVLEDADTNTVTVHASTASGTNDLDANLSSTTMTRQSVGVYYADYTCHSTDATGEARLDFSWSISGDAMKDAGIAVVGDATPPDSAGVTTLLSRIGTPVATVSADIAAVKGGVDTLVARPPVTANVTITPIQAVIAGGPIGTTALNAKLNATMPPLVFNPTDQLGNPVAMIGPVEFRLYRIGSSVPGSEVIVDTILATLSNANKTATVQVPKADNAAVSILGWTLWDLGVVGGDEPLTEGTYAIGPAGPAP